jgi:lipid II:glycine glycyltransferase (peptidoglycan interpeptide bridge formation enzyme)
MKVREESSVSEWEAFVGANAPQALFAGWPWGDVETRLGHRVHRLAWDRNGSIAAVASAIVVSGKRGRILHLRHGPVMSSWKPDAFAAVLADCAALARKEGCSAVRMSPLTLDPQARELMAGNHLLEAPIHGMDAQRCLVLDLSKSETELLSGFRKSTRYDIRKGESAGVTVETTTGEDGLRAFLDLYDDTARRQGFVGHEGIPEEYSVYGKLGMAEIITASLGGKPVSSALILYYQDQGIYHHGASVTGGPPASALVQWTAIRHAKAKGMRWYNFWGIAPEEKPGHPWRGLSLFKRGFGGTELVYPCSYDLPLTPAYYVIRTLEWLRKRTKGY